MDSFYVIGILFFMFFLYIAPSYVAYSRNHRNKEPILVINLFLGWTLVAWVLCLAWALMIERKPA